MSGPYTQQLLDAHAPWLADDVSGDLRGYLTALGVMADPVATIVSDVGFPDDPGYVPGWSVLLDPDNCPTQFLPWLGMFLGVSVPPGTSDADGRALIRQHAGFSRGTVGAMRAAAQRKLLGTQSCVVLERTAADGSHDAYHMVFVMRPDECQDLPAVSAAVEAVKPAGLQITYVLTDAWTISQLESAYGSITADEGAFSFIMRLEQEQLG